jgi:hypothetical protein
MGARPAAEDDPPESKSDALGAGPDLPEVVSDVPQAVDGGFPEPSGNDPGDISSDPSPHHALNAPVGAPDPTEWPDPYDQRSDPRDPPRSDGEPFAEEPHPPVGSTSTSDPHPDAATALQTSATFTVVGGLLRQRLERTRRSRPTEIRMTRSWTGPVRPCGDTLNSSSSPNPRGGPGPWLDGRSARVSAPCGPGLPSGIAFEAAGLSE